MLFHYTDKCHFFSFGSLVYTYVDSEFSAFQRNLLLKRALLTEGSEFNSLSVKDCFVERKDCLLLF